ncbi:MAG: FecR family protein [Alphaproteobacteria bacterium]
MRHLKTIGAAALAACLAAGAAQAQSIGSVQLVEVWAYGTPPTGGKQDRYVRDQVVANELVETVANGAMHLMFSDGSELRLGSASTATLDSFVYDPGAGGGEMTVNMTRGAFRFISGKINKSAVKLRTPTALIGIRGTDLLINVDPFGATVVSVIAGTVTVQNANGGGEASVSAGQAVSVAAATAAPAITAPNEMDEGLEDASPGAGAGAGPGAGGAAPDQGSSSPGED